MSETDTLGTLPEWDLSVLYSAPDAPALEQDLSDTDAAAGRFAEAYEGKLDSLSGDALADAIVEYERIQEVLGRVMSYAQLVYSRDMSDPKAGQFCQTASERVNAISTRLLFFVLEINRLEDEALKALVDGSGALGNYWPWLRDVRVMRPHQLSDEAERLLHEKSITGRAAWNRLFDETLAALRFPFEDEQLTTTEILDKLLDHDGATRKRAAVTLGRTLKEHAQTFALITNTLAKDKEIQDRWRKLERPVSGRNLSNLVEDEVVDALVDSVKRAYPRLSHRYYALKAKWLGGDRLDYWDRLAPLPEEEDRLIPWDEARGTVLDAYAAFSPDLAGIGRRFFENGWIDAPARPGKATGAFAHPTVPSAHPYLLLNYQGKTRDVMTLAHELGHGVHQVLAGAQGYLMADTPLTLAETASVFGEMLTFQALLAATRDPAQRRAMLAAKVEDMLNTVVRQVAFFEFERIVHDERRNGELSVDRLGEIWMEVGRESLGPALRFDDEYRSYWAYIPHFVHSPFYVYAYAFGDCLVNSLYSLYEEAEQGFADRYLEMLKAGGTLRHKELLAPFGLNASDPAFWDKGLGVIERLVDQLEGTE